MSQVQQNTVDEQVGMHTRIYKFNTQFEQAATIGEMQKVCQLHKSNQKGNVVRVGHWFRRLAVRRFSIYITWLFVRIGISANATTFLMIACGLAGVTMCIPHILWLNALGVSLLMMAEVFDCVDGEIARWTKSSSLRGLYLDLAAHLLCDPLLAAVCALHLYVLTGGFNYILLAFVAYGAAHCRRGLRVIHDQVILPQIPADHRSKPLISGGRNPGSPLDWSQIKWGLARIASRLTDFFTIRVVSLVGIFLSHAGTNRPLIFAAWYLAVLGILWVVADIMFKFFFFIPKVQHVKKV